MLRDVEGVEGTKEAAPITVFMQRKETLKNTKTLLGGGGEAVNYLRILALSLGYLTPAKSEG
jgi:hypothetical protein